MSKSFGTLLIYDIEDLAGDITNRIELQCFIDVLVEDIMKMKKVGSTIFEYFPPNKYNIENDLVGYSISQIISTSSITIHICDISKNAYIDIFTCAKVDDVMEKEIDKLIEEVFKPSIMNKQSIERPVKKIN